MLVIIPPKILVIVFNSPIFVYIRQIFEVGCGVKDLIEVLFIHMSA